MNLRPALVATALLAVVATVFSAIVATAAPTRYEAELAPATCDGVVAATHSGYSGSGYCDGRNAVGAAAQFAVDNSAAGTAKLTVRFANGTAAVRIADVIVNGSKTSTVAFEATGGWATWVTTTVTLSLNSGTNTVRFSPAGADGLPNLDYAEFDVTAQSRSEAESSPATCDGTIDSNYAGFSGTGFCNGDNAIGAAAQFVVNATGAGSVALAVRFANGTTARPADVLVNNTRVQSTSFESTGAWSTWTTKTMTVSLNSGSNTVRFSPTTSGGLPNIDYLDLTLEPNPTPCDPPTTPPTTPPTQPRVTIWLAGDSTMANPSGGATCPVGWGHQFSQDFNSNVTVKNSAVGGRSIQTWLYDPNVTSRKNSAGECIINPGGYSERWRAMLDSANGMKPGDYLFIQFGINDGSSTCPRHVGSARYRELLGMMASAAKARGAHPVFLTPVAALRCSGSTAVGNRGFITETNSAARTSQVPVIDLHRLSYTLYNTLRFCPFNGDWGSGPVGAFFCNDHTHFDVTGARQIAGVVSKAVRDQRIPLAAYLK